MADTLDLVGPKSGTAPLTYTLSELGTVDWQSAFASFDGTSAATAYAPVLTVRSQNGTIIARSKPSDAVVAGASADVSWFRRLGEHAGPSPFATTYSALIAELATSRNLLGYWKLSEAASPFADTSGNAGGPSNMVRQVLGTAMTFQVPGALPPGQDLYGVGFNVANNANGDWLRASAARFAISTTSFSLTCFVNPTANANIFRGHAFGNYNPAVGSPNQAEGIGLFVDWPTRTLRFDRSVQSGASEAFDQCDGSDLIAGDWVFVAGVYDSLAAKMFLYENGTLMATTTSTLTAGSGGGAAIGRSNSPAIDYAQPPNFLRPGTFYGDVDECGFWGAALSSAEVQALAVAAGYA